MFSFLILLSLQVLPDFNTMSSVSFSSPDDWSSPSTCVDQRGRIIAGCSRWNTELHEHEVWLFVVGESVDTVKIADERITSLVSICPASKGGYFVTFPSEFNSDRISAARLNADGSLDWLVDRSGDAEPGLRGSIAFAETPGEEYVLGGDLYNIQNSRYNDCLYVAMLGEDGTLRWEAEGEPEAQIHAVVADPQGLILAGEKPGSQESQAYAWCYSYAGDLLWERGYDLGGFGEFDCVSQLTDGFIFGGTHWPLDGPMCGLLIRTDQYGNEMWRKLISPEEGYQQLYIRAVASADDGSIIAAGFSPLDHAPRNTDDAVAFLLNSSGDVFDTAFYGKPEQNHEEFNHIMNDPEGGFQLYGLCRGDDYDGIQLIAFPPFNPSE